MASIELASPQQPALSNSAHFLSVFFTESSVHGILCAARSEDFSTPLRCSYIDSNHSVCDQTLAPMATGVTPAAFSFLKLPTNSSQVVGWVSMPAFFIVSVL